MLLKGYQISIERLYPDIFIFNAMQCREVALQFNARAMNGLNKLLDENEDECMGAAKLAGLLASYDPESKNSKEDKLARIKQELNAYWETYTPTL